MTVQELKKLITLIQQQYDLINKKWLDDENYYPLNMKKKRVEDVYNDETLLQYVFNYRKFINDNVAEMVKLIQSKNFENVVNTRVKALNSIQYKIHNYELNHENGKIPLKKCLNDIFGIRMIFNDNINYNEVSSFIEREFSELKCISSVRGKYVAIHIYFGNDDNMKFQWELQLWDKKHEKTNLESHAKYILTTHLKLEKLVYMCYADYLCSTKEKLFNDRIYAYKLGPVIETVYEKYKKAGHDDLAVEDDRRTYNDTDKVMPIRSRILSSSNGLKKIISIDKTLEKYSNYSASFLVDLTHKNSTPWSKSGAGRIANKLISDSLILKYHLFEEI